MKPTQTERLLDLLADRRWHHMRQLNDICFRYGGRIHELRHEGYVIEGERLKTGEWRYRLVAVPGETRQLAFV